MPILKGQVNSSSDFPSFFSAITYNSSVSLKKYSSAKKNTEELSFITLNSDAKFE